MMLATAYIRSHLINTRFMRDDNQQRNYYCSGATFREFITRVKADALN